MTLRGVLEEFPDVFQDKPGRTSMIEHSIETDSAQPVRLPPYRLSHACQAVKDKLEEMISGIIEPVASEWSAPIVPVKKREGSLRLCVDYRQLNQVFRSDAYPMPRVGDLIDRVGKSTCISTLDTRLLAGPSCYEGPAQDSFYHSFWAVPIQHDAI